jgi:hypothetical protein
MEKHLRESGEQMAHSPCSMADDEGPDGETARCARMRDALRA